MNTDHFFLVTVVIAVLYVFCEMQKPWNNGTNWAEKNAEIDEEIRKAVKEMKK